MKKNIVLFTCAVTITFVVSLLSINCKTPIMAKKPSLAGTSWQMTEKVIGLDSAPTITFNYVLKFIDEKNAQLTQLEDYSSVTGTFVKDDGTVDYTPGSSTEKVKKGTYVVDGNVITIQFEKDENDRFDDGKPKIYRNRGSYLIYDLEEKEYDELPEYRREYYTYKRIK